MSFRKILFSFSTCASLFDSVVITIVSLHNHHTAVISLALWISSSNIVRQLNSAHPCNMSFKCRVVEPPLWKVRQLYLPSNTLSISANHRRHWKRLHYTLARAADTNTWISEIIDSIYTSKNNHQRTRHRYSISRPRTHTHTPPQAHTHIHAMPIIISDLQTLLAQWCLINIDEYTIYSRCQLLIYSLFCAFVRPILSFIRSATFTGYGQCLMLSHQANRVRER